MLLLVVMLLVWHWIPGEVGVELVKPLEVVKPNLVVEEVAKPLKEKKVVSLVH